MAEPLVPHQGQHQTVGNIYIEGNVQGERLFTFNQTQIIQVQASEIKNRSLNKTSPYKGLKRFERSDKDLYFGRDQFLTGLVNELQQSNLILLLGASGSGKSSAIRAGLLPWLAKKWGSDLIELSCTPDQDPFDSLYATLRQHYQKSEVEFVRQSSNDNTLLQVVNTLKRESQFWLILVDQFEELFTTSQAELRDRFINNVLKLHSNLPAPDIARIKIIATMRADFLDRLSPYPRLVKVTDKHRPFIAEMQLDELRLAIEQPAAQHGVVFEDGLVDQIIKDVQGQAGYLPLLQYTLNLLWETEVRSGHIQSRELTCKTYRQLGGVRGALQQHVDRIYQDLTLVEQNAAKSIFLKIVEIGGDESSEAGWKPVRKHALRSEFVTEVEQQVLAKLINENLLVSSTPIDSSTSQRPTTQATVEIAHEVLLTSWRTLNQWIRENRLAIALRNRLNDDVKHWQTTKADDELWNGAKLEKVIELRKDPIFNQVLGGFSHEANGFIDASAGLRDRQRRRLIVRLAGFSIVTLSLAMVAGWQLWRAELQRQGTISALTTNSEKLLDSKQEFDALLTALKAAKQTQQSVFQISPDVQRRVRMALQEAITWGQEQNRLVEHESAVNSVSFSPNNRFLASAHSDNLIKLWDISTGRATNLTKHNTNVIGVSFSPNGEQLASVDANGAIKLWDVNTQELLYSLESGSQLTGISFSLDGQQLASGSRSGPIKLWDADTGQSISVFPGHLDGTNSVSFSPNGKQIVSCGNDGTIKLWDIKTGEIIKEFQSSSMSGFVDSVSFSPDGQLLTSAGEDRVVRVWDVNTGQEIRKFSGHQERIMSVRFSPDGRTVASAGWDRTIKLWDVASGKEISTLFGHGHWVNSLSFSLNGQLLASASNDHTVRIWSLNRDGVKPIVSSNHAGIWSVNFSPDGRRVAFAGKRYSTITIWDINSDKEVNSFEEGDAFIKSVVFSPVDDRLLASGGYGGNVKLWNSVTGQEIFSQQVGAYIESVQFSPDGQLLATAGWDGKIKFWNVATGEEMTTLKGHAAKIISIGFSADGNILASGSEDSTIKLWDVKTKQELGSLKGHTAGVRSVAFSTDGKLLVSGSSDNTIKLWDVVAKQEIRVFRGHTAGINSVSLSPDGMLLASGSPDHTIKLWNVATGEEITTLQVRTSSAIADGVASVNFSPDGRWLVSGGEQSVLLWDIQTLKRVEFNALMMRGCRWIRNYLTNNPDVDSSERQLCKGVTP